MKIALWWSLGLLCYAYLGYPFIAWIMAATRPRKETTAQINPAVSIVMAVRNGIALLPWKIEHLLGLDYRNIKEIIIVSDGSTDGTAEYLSCLSDPRLKVILLTEHSGKAVALNAGMAIATADVMLFVDIRPEIAPDAIQRLVNHFADPAVGCVAGELGLLQDGHDAVTAAVGGLYWRFEQWLRKCEARFDSAIGVYGGFYAVKKELAVPQPPGIILDDMYQPLSVIRKGYRTVIEPQAYVYDKWPSAASGEFRRKVRTLAGNYQLIQIAPWILTFRNRTVIQLVSHKILRLFAPYLYLAALAAALVLASRSELYLALAGILVLGILLGIAGMKTNIPVLNRITAPAAAFLMLNAASVVGLYKYLITRGALWKIWG